MQAWFTEHAIVQNGSTWLVRRIWGRATEPTLITLRDAFPEAKVSFQRATSSA
ncbi:hypothetical protein ACQP1P_01460 [Dactylosporangium sp. CA-052675]|uniref:hypothetical protein n=1 Tax=Dactylosporangium sp. CA-052675 TaxID=3239927 RepID=UPI003D90261C